MFPDTVSLSPHFVDRGNSRVLLVVVYSKADVEVMTNSAGMFNSTTTVLHQVLIKAAGCYLIAGCC
jgi:hypothetical protein